MAQINTGAMLSSMAGHGAANAKHFSISNFTGAGLDQAGLFKVLGDEKDTFSPVGNMDVGVLTMMGNARGGAESLLKRMTDVFLPKDEAWKASPHEMLKAAGAFMESNRDAIAGPNSPDWHNHAANTPPGTPIDPNHGAFQHFRPVPMQSQGGSDIPMNGFSQAQFAGQQMSDSGMAYAGNVNPAALGLFSPPSTPGQSRDRGLGGGGIAAIS